MKKSIFPFSILIVFVLSLVLTGCHSGNKKGEVSFVPNPVVLPEQEVTTLEIGQKAPAFKLPDMHGKYVTLDDFKKAEVLVIAFISNHCPTAQAYEDRLIEFTNDYNNRNVTVVAINPNSSAALLLEECGYSDIDDSFETMLIRAETKGYNFPYLYDGDDQAVSISYGPHATPHVFVFDAERMLRYSGRIDGVERPGTANGEDLRQAVDQVLAGEEVTTPNTKSFGCSVKWSWKADWAKKVNSDWAKQPVSLNVIDSAGVYALLVNDSEKLRLVNVWATWCAPCVIELPDLIELQRMYGARSFEFITISADQMDKQVDVLKMLTDKHLPVQNFIFDNSDKYKLIELVDPEWSGALPYSMLIEPGGNVVYKTQGIVDLLKLKRVIVEHPLMGRYF